MAIRIGVDIGGTGMKAGVVDLESGSLIGDRIRMKTPRPATPEAVTEALGDLLDEVGREGPVGVGFPAVVTSGQVRSANNIDKSWIGVNAAQLFAERTGREIRMVNDADAAAICEARYGAARGVDGVVLMVTFGTGIGSGLLLDRRLAPNLELGNLEVDGHIPAEDHFSASAREEAGIEWDEWGLRANRFLEHVVKVFSPALIVVGGGVAKRWDRWSHRLGDFLPVIPAERGNRAGIVGAAILVEDAEVS